MNRKHAHAIETAFHVTLPTQVLVRPATPEHPEFCDQTSAMGLPVRLRRFPIRAIAGVLPHPKVSRCLGTQEQVP